ncbi:MAG: SGNH/GDSL hydrolase family protein [Clostridia bacterium]|nr:SGNH/GDSL hydrolase family protein [Clostridia bacterium]
MKTRIKIIGDSLASGMGTSGSVVTDELLARCNGQTFYRRSGGCGWAQLLKKEYPKLDIINCGCDGMTSTQALACLRELYSPSDDTVMLLLGANDRKEVSGMDRLYRNLTAIVTEIKRDGNLPVLLTPNPASRQNEARSDRLYHHCDVVKVVRSISLELGVPLIDIHSDILASGVDVESIMSGGDGNHPTDRMAALMYACVRRGLGL